MMDSSIAPATWPYLGLYLGQEQGRQVGGGRSWRHRHRLTRASWTTINPTLDYGPSDFDVDHRFVASYVYNCPSARQEVGGGVNRAADLLIGGWEVTGITTFQTGSHSVSLRTISLVLRIPWPRGETIFRAAISTAVSRASSRA